MASRNSSPPPLVKIPRDQQKEEETRPVSREQGPRPPPLIRFNDVANETSGKRDFMRVTKKVALIANS